MENSLPALIRFRDKIVHYNIVNLLHYWRKLQKNNIALSFLFKQKEGREECYDRFLNAAIRRLMEYGIVGNIAVWYLV